MRWNRWQFLAVLAVAATVLVTGCENDGGDDGDDSSGSSAVGVWAVKWSSADSWWRFKDDGTFAMYDDANLEAKHLSGNYSQDGNKVTGTFVNPGVGEGEIDATISEDGQTMQIDFIEHWHNPYKHVPLTGTRL